MNFKIYLLAVIFIISSKNVSAQICFSNNIAYQDSFTAIISELPICSADFNTDGFKDIATVGDSIVSIFFGSSSGITTPPYYLRVPRELSFICEADFNNDGFKDIAVSDLNEVYIITGNGAGVMTISHTFTLALNISNMGTADFNGDGFRDLAFISSQSSLSVLLGTGARAFSSPTSYSVSAGTVKFCTGDFNGDNMDDIVSVNSNANNISVMLSNSSGILNPATTYSLVSPVDVCSADFNQDGYDDIATACNDSYGLSVLLSNSSGIFSTPVNYHLGGLEVTAICTEDFNGDGFKDIFIGESNPIEAPYQTNFLLGNSSGNFGNASYVDPPSTWALTVLGTDLNGDGKLDLVENIFDNVYVYIRYNCSSTSGIAGMNEPALSVYPNPCSNKLNIDFPGNLPQRITIYNVLGETVFEGTEFQQKNIQIDVSKYPQGVYSVSIENEGKTTSKKLVIANP